MMWKRFLNRPHHQVSGNVNTLHGILKIIGEKVSQSQEFFKKWARYQNLRGVKNSKSQFFRGNLKK